MTIQAKSLRKEFDVPEGIEVAVNSIDLEIEEDEFVTLVGPSGCGKTTTLRCIAGLETPTSGKLLINDEDVTDVPPNKRGLSMMFQNIALYPHMTIRENIAYPLKVRGVPKEQRAQEASDAAEIMQIPELLDKHPAELSGGQRQRAALARTVVQDPQAFLMDEPLSDLDAKLKVEIRKEIQRVHKRVGKPTLYVTHDQEEAMTMSDRIAVMNDGNLEQVGSPDELYTRPVNTFVAQFIGNPSMNFVTGDVVDSDDSSITLDVYGTRLDIDVNYEDELTGSTVTVGFRPEIVTLDQTDSEGYFSGEITLIERIGDRMQATVEGPEGELRAVVPADNELTEGEEAAISFETDHIHVFDANTGDIVARGARTQATPTKPT
ncbi:ABC transporter ATP-binding protein [Salinirarus marinus]|uniref:ABC transporter ATP-binding protein n=1 Tax=Salinirarus marinus TaxID=3068310 RepID=UPI003C6C9519